MIFKNDNLVCCSPKHSVSGDSFSSFQFVSSPNKLSYESNTKFPECLENQSLNSPNSNTIKSFSSNDLTECQKTSEKVCAEAVYSKTKDLKR